nr:reverse transcriptase domain-containing protein [Tanacetum cinerariifolium]
MEELCQPTLNGRGGPIAPIAIQGTNFGLKNEMIQQVQNSCPFRGPGDDANKHLDKFLHVTQSMKVNGVSDDALRLHLFPYSLQLRAAEWFDRFLRNSITTLYDTFYNGLTMRHRDTINAAAGGTFMKRRPEECYDLIENMTAHHNDWDTSAQQIECEIEVTKDTVPPTTNGGTKDVQPLVVQVETHVPIPEHVEAPISAPKPNLKPSIPYPSGLSDQKHREKANNQIEKFYQIFQDLHFDISFADALILMPEMDECLALADLGASINLMPLSVWKRLSLPELTPTCMALELADRTISRSIDIAEDVSVKAGKHALIDVYKGELTLRVGNEAVTFNFDQTSRYSANYDDMMANRIDVIDMACEEYSQEITGFFDVIMSANPTPYYEPIISTSSPTLTPFGDSDFLLEEFNAFLAFEDDPTSPKVDHFYYDTKKDILFLKAFLNDDPSLPPLTQGMYLPQIWKELKICDDKLPVIIAKDLSIEEKAALIKVLKSHKQAIAWQLFDIKGINPKFCTHKILIEDDFKPAVQHQIRVNPKIHDVIKKEVLKLLDAGLIYPISDSPWDMIEKMMEVFMDDFSVFRNSFETCLSHLGKMLKRCKDTNFCLNWEKRHFMVKEGIVIGHNISKNRMELDKAKVDVITKLSHPTMVKGAVLGQRKEKHFWPIHYASKTMTEAQVHYTTTEKEMLAVVHAFKKFRSYLVLSKSIVYMDHSALKYLFDKQDAKRRLLRWVLILQEFDISV